MSKDIEVEVDPFEGPQTQPSKGTESDRGLHPAPTLVKSLNLSEATCNDFNIILLQNHQSHSIFVKYQAFII